MKACQLMTLLAALLASVSAGEPKRPELVSWLGQTPKLDGKISPGEWSDATQFQGVRDWVPEFSPVADDKDLSLRGWVKHDEQRLYFAFDITDDVLYGIDTPRWLPPENPSAHELTPKGFPWFGDEMEILINAPNTWTGNESAEGSGSSWQMVCNLTKSRLDGLNAGGLLEGEPRSDAKAWATYQRWIQTGAQRATARPKAGGKGYIIEWSIQFDPCLETQSGKFYSPAQGEAKVGLNIALGDLDTPEKGAGNYGGFHHEQWFAGALHTRTQKNNFGTLRLMGRKKRL
jgi:SSS family solute:Na+ symporter